jgi:regulator of sigma E protease
LGILSVNLAVINILPFPPLDGGKVLFIGAEAIWGRKLAPKIEKWVQNLGMILLLLLLVLVTLQDISRIL